MLRSFRLPLALVALAVLAAPSAAEQNSKEISLFNGKNLDGWGYYLVDPDVAMKDVWSVADGILVCQGEPMGYLATEREFKDFKLVVEWRWAPGKEPGNSGVLLRITGEPKALPRCVEAQLKHGNVGDIWAFQGFRLKGDADRFVEKENERIGRFMGVTRKAGNEKQPGEWNEYVITLEGGKLSVELNGQLINQARDCDEVAGKIGLQSEGGEIHFRAVKLIPIQK